MQKLPLELIATRILIIRGQRVMIDTDLADLYGIPTKALNQAVKRNTERFPADFMFQLTADEKQQVVTNCDHLSKLKFSRSNPYVFTEHGAIQAANVLNSPEAIAMGVYVVRAFVRLREVILSNNELTQRLDELEQRIQYRMDTQDETITALMNALRELMTPPEPRKRPIGFIYPDNK